MFALTASLQFHQGLQYEEIEWKKIPGPSFQVPDNKPITPEPLACLLSDISPGLNVMTPSKKTTHRNGKTIYNAAVGYILKYDAKDHFHSSVAVSI